MAGPLPSPLAGRHRGRRSVPARRSLVLPSPPLRPPRPVPPFSLLGSLPRLAQYTAANLFGGIPLYVPSSASTAVTAGLAAVAVLLAGLTALRWHRIGAPRTRLLLTLAALAPPVGLRVLDVIFNSTPIELRYLAFATPFAGLLLAGALASLPSRWCLGLGGALLAIQAVALLGLMMWQETMQPVRATAAALADGGVLLPRGNDSVGVVGAFVNEAPDQLRLSIAERPMRPRNQMPASAPPIASCWR